MKRSLQHFAAATGGHLQGADRTFTAVSTDSRTLPAGALFVALVGPSFDGHDFLAQAAERGAAGAIVQRRCDSSLPQIVVGDTLRALQDAAQAWRNQFALPVVAVAGSNGKTTTKELAAAILRETGPCLSTQGTLNNHIGVPLTLLGLDEIHRTAVIEIGANHPGEVAALVAIARPTVGLVTNAGAEHLEGFGDLDGVARAEGEMFAGLEPGATAILNADDAYADLWRTMNRADRVVTFGLEAAADFGVCSRRESIRAGGFVQELELRTPAGQATVELRLAGRHNASNALAAAAATSAAGAGLEAIVQGLGRAVPVKGRLQPKAARGGAWLIDDSYNANPSSVRAGLDVLAELQGERWLVLGDMGELGEHAVAAHTEAGSYARQRGVTRLYAVGTLTPHAVQAFGPGATSYADPAALVEALRPALRPGVNVLVKGSRSNRLERVVEALRNTDDAA